MANQVKILETTIHIGDVIKVHHKVKEKDKERVQVFGGVVISIKGAAENKSFTVRRIASGGIGVERIWPLNSPVISKIEVKKRGKVKRAKLYYLRKRVGKRATRVKTTPEKKIEKVKKETVKKEPTKKPKPKTSPKKIKK